MRIMAIAFLILLLTGCNGAMQDKKTAYDLPVVKEVEEHSIVHTINHDGMYRSEQFKASAQLVVDPNFYKHHEISRGDIVYYATSASAENITNKTQQAYDIARIIGLPGEVISIKKGQVFIDGQKLDTFYGKEFYNGKYVDGTAEAYTMPKEITIPSDHYFFVGDVWRRSGMIEEAVAKTMIQGKVIAQLQP